jgi:hypothetical protein
MTNTKTTVQELIEKLLCSHNYTLEQNYNNFSDTIDYLQSMLGKDVNYKCNKCNNVKKIKMSASHLLELATRLFYHNFKREEQL